MQYPKCKVIANLSTFESHGLSKQINVHSPIGFKVYSYINPNDYFYISICLRKVERPIMLGGKLMNFQSKVKNDKVSIGMYKILDFIRNPFLELNL